MIFNYNLGPGGRYELEFVISSCIYKIDYFTIHFLNEWAKSKLI
jgi:cytochrome c oxidase subunit IV